MITGSDYDKWLLQTNNTMEALAETGLLTAEQLMEAFDKLQEDFNIDAAEDALNKTYDSMQSLLDIQISLAESGQNWTDSLKGQAGNIADISKALTKMDVGKLKFEKADIKLQRDYAKNFLKASGDIGKEKRIREKNLIMTK